MPFFALMADVDLSKSPMLVPRSRRLVGQVVVTHAEGDEDDRFVQVNCHGNSYEFRPWKAVEVPEVSRARFLQFVGSKDGLPIREVKPGTLDYERVHKETFREPSLAPEPKTVTVIPSERVLNRFTVDDLTELAALAGIVVHDEATKVEIIGALNAAR